jgi:acylphosphatase
MMRKRAHVFYSGRVQGVGFRYSAREVACGFEVTGFIRNLHDGRVEMVAEGDEEEVKSFLDAMRASHLGSCIRGADVRWVEATTEFNGFNITF